MKVKNIREIKSKVKIVQAVEKIEENLDRDVEETHEGHFDETPSLESTSFQGGSFRPSTPRSLSSSVGAVDPSLPIRSNENDETQNEKKNDFRMYEIQRTFGDEANRYKSSSGGLNVPRSQSVSVRDSAMPGREFFSSVDQPGVNSSESNNEKYAIEKTETKKDRKGHGYAWDY